VQVNNPLCTSSQSYIKVNN